MLAHQHSGCLNRHDEESFFNCWQSLMLYLHCRLVSATDCLPLLHVEADVLRTGSHFCIQHSKQLRCSECSAEPYPSICLACADESLSFDPMVLY